MTYGLEISKKVFYGDECEKVADVLDNDVHRRVRYSWKGDELTVWQQDIDDLKEQEAYDIQDKLEEINIASLIYEEEYDYDPDWEKEYETLRHYINHLIKIR